MRMELGLPPLHLRREALRLLYWEPLCNADPDRLVSVVFRRRYEEARAGDARYSWFRATERIMHKWDLQGYWSSRSAEPRETWKDQIWLEHDVQIEMANREALVLWAADHRLVSLVSLSH